MTSAPATKTTRGLKHAFGLVVVAFMLLTTLAVTPPADAQLDQTSQWEIVTKPCVAPYVAWPGGLEGNGSAICYDANPYFDGVYGDQGAFGCGGGSTVDGRTVYGDVDDGYDVNQFPYVEVLLGCYYYPGITIVRTYAPPTFWTVRTYDYSSWSLGF